MNPQLFIHPDDAAALKILQGIPGLPSVVDWYMKNGIEQISWLQNTAYCVRLSQRQMPEVYNRLPPICAQLGIPIPELYLNPDDYSPNAETYGIHRVYITVTRGLIKRFSPEELDAVLAHECGHILCKHTYYKAIASDFLSLASLSGNENIVGSLTALIGGTAMVPLKKAFYAWQRKSELSADRAAGIVCGKDIFYRVMAKLAMIPKPILETIDLDEWAMQGKSIREFESGGFMQKALKYMSSIENCTHPPEVLRAYEFKKWVESSEYRFAMQHVPAKQISAPGNKKIGGDVKTSLLELKKMLDLGLIDQQDYDNQKKQILGI